MTPDNVVRRVALAGDLAAGRLPGIGPKLPRQLRYLFSIAVIYLMNILVLGLVLTFICDTFDLADLASAMRGSVSEAYARFARAAGTLSAR